MATASERPAKKIKKYPISSMKKRKNKNYSPITSYRRFKKIPTVLDRWLGQRFPNCGSRTTGGPREKI